MSPDGYRARLWLIEWTVDLWRAHGASHDFCERSLHYFQEALDADFYGEPRPAIDDPEILALQRYFDDQFSRPGIGIACGREYIINYS
jgi:hypothetical protein